MSGVVGAIYNRIQAEQAFQQKQDQMKQASVSVAGSDDIDLLSYYAENRAKVCEYKISDNTKNNLADMFYYYGYASTETKTPVVNTRRWFNYLQCNAVINNLKNINEKFLNDLVERYSQGVTILHWVNQTWDFAQVKANNESWLGA